MSFDNILHSFGNHSKGHKKQAKEMFGTFLRNLIQTVSHSLERGSTLHPEVDKSYHPSSGLQAAHYHETCTHYVYYVNNIASSFVRVYLSFNVWPAWDRNCYLWQVIQSLMVIELKWTHMNYKGDRKQAMSSTYHSKIMLFHLLILWNFYSFPFICLYSYNSHHYTTERKPHLC